MFFSSVQVVFQECPNEISLAFSISGCKLKCVGCHSAFTWNPMHGEELTQDKFLFFIDKYKGLITCVVFYGGEWEIEKLKEYLDIAILNGLKTCLYTGLELNDFESVFLKSVTYIKTGKYIKKIGGLNSAVTNQKFYKLSNGSIADDLTNGFIN
jgi:anaerobic ribonucleoside-triphosphate reductase activating protein